MLYWANPFHIFEVKRSDNSICDGKDNAKSLFYIMLMTCERHTIDGHTSGAPGEEAKRQVVMRRGQPPYRKWFGQQDYDTLGSLKGTFFSDVQIIELSPLFGAWLRALQYRFSDGFEFKSAYTIRKERAGSSAGAVAPFGGETLGSCIHYFPLVRSARNRAGELGGLIICYKPHIASVSGSS
jgi:hypothetical protein